MYRSSRRNLRCCSTRGRNQNGSAPHIGRQWNEGAHGRARHAGRKFNHKYGFGKLDAYKLVEAAKTFEHVKPQAWYHSEKVVVEDNIPDNTVEGLTSVVVVTPDNLTADNFEKVEHVQILMNLTHQRRGDVVIDLISPTGQVSHICTKRKFDTSADGMVGWYFMSVKHW